MMKTCMLSPAYLTLPMSRLPQARSHAPRKEAVQGIRNHLAGVQGALLGPLCLQV